MLDELDADSLLAEVIMSHDAGHLVVVVEGDLDEEFVQDHVMHKCAIVNARGKQRILSVLSEILEGESPALILLDRDFDFDIGNNSAHPNVIYTDRYNLESTLLLSPQIFDRVWRLHVQPSARVNQIAADEALSICCEVATCIGNLRYLSVRLKIGLTLDAFPVSALIAPRCRAEDVRVDVLDVVDLTLKRSAQSPWLRRRCARKEAGHEERARRYLMRELRRQSTSPPADPISGHDVSRTLNVILSRVRKSGPPSPKDLERHASVEFGNVTGHGIRFVETLRARAAEMGFAA